MKSDNFFEVVTDFLLAYPRQLPTEVFQRILNPVLSGAKSNNATVRSQSCHMFSVLVNREGTDEEAFSIAVTELIALPKASRTTGADHRIALYTMLRAVKPVSGVASGLSSSLPSLLAKETNDVAVSQLAQTLAPHVTFCLRENQTLPSEVINTLVREMSSSKPALRRAFCTVAGNALWDLDGVRTDAARSFAAALLPAFESNLNTIFSSPLNSVAGPLEGYVALASLLGSVSRLDIPKYSEIDLSVIPMKEGATQRFLDDVISRSVAIQGVVVVSSAKPHFLLWQKCYQKLNTVEEETWFLRALQAGLSFFTGEFSKSEILR